MSSETLFSSLQSAEDWPCWAKPIQKVEWTSPQPFGIGTTRTVFMSGGMTGYEEFIAWERGREMAFCFTHCSKPNVDSFAERYEITPLAEDRCRLVWTMAMKPKGVSLVIMPVVSPLLRIGVKSMLRSLKRMLEKRAR
ncbi:SRPBCC family protein [Spongiibacter sp. KMU-158]|uniref:SRPBCC family protein n=1 Tax=Spongiibacter pelagi TaxID=2760804 RepID=A0A927C1W8_9GAMM|nr:SRPBCC family protein [Spongiibacter pelagi]